MGQPIARIGDSIGHAAVTGTILGPGSLTVISGGIIVAKQGDAVFCKDHPNDPNFILVGSTTVKTVGGVLGVARIGDVCTCGATISTGNSTVLVGP